ncbi:hypothetical protein ACNJX9_01550 [Bradyrhizobium sp. DASA03076]|uniref:Uncharacterized protein n=1 Tax=Bradyrhizobium manausense TaxID=989370 RepID=A0A0R3E606_9BRAD|nr:hypothetical protein [Bradyrhizobium manausense]KRQ17571.1 hypothetical protein AOQ71_00820 [Bradyrhizobium manausense]
MAMQERDGGEQSPGSTDGLGAFPFRPGKDASSISAMLLAGVAILGAFIGWFLTMRAEPDAPIIALVPQEQIADAIPTLTPDNQRIAQSDSRQCRYPVAFITVSTPGNPAGGTVTFRTSKYRSPSFHVTDQPQRIALPNPLPDSGGLDPLTAEGNAKGLLVSLYPTARMEPATGSTTVTVRWPARPPCK